MKTNIPCIILSFGLRGGRCITSSAGGSILNATAGGPSVTRFSHRIMAGSSGIGKPIKAKEPTRTSSVKLRASRNLINFRMFSYMIRPPFTALTIVAKLSSASIISEASLVTSVPVMPIATPMSACLSAGASFTPSPVIATEWPFPFSALTIRSLCSGETLA